MSCCDPKPFDPKEASADYHSPEGWEITAALARAGYLVMMSDQGSEIAQRAVDDEADFWRAALHAIEGALSPRCELPERAKIRAVRKIVHAMLAGRVAR